MFESQGIDLGPYALSSVNISHSWSYARGSEEKRRSRPQQSVPQSPLQIGCGDRAASGGGTSTSGGDLGVDVISEGDR